MDLSYGPYWPDFHLSDTADVALSANGVAYVTGRRVVVRIDVDGSISEFAVPPDGLLGPADLAVDPEGTVYISWNSNRVWKYTPEGQGVEIVDETGDGDGHPLVSPIAVAVDSDHNVYVVSATNDLVFKVTSTGSVTVVLDHSGDGMGHILDGPVDLAIDGADNLFVAGAFSRNAFRVRPDGEITELIDRFGTSAGNQTQIAQPSGVATDSEGNFYLVDYLGGAFKVTPGGTKFGISAGIDPFLFYEPHRIATDLANNVYVTAVNFGEYDKDGYPYSPGSNTIHKIPPGGPPELIFDGVGQAEVEKGFFEVPEFGFPEDMAIDAAGNVYVVSWATDSVFRVTLPGGIRRILDWTGDGVSHYLNNPSSVAVDPQGNVYVAGYLSDNVFKITPEGTITQIIDSAGDGLGHQLMQPSEITVRPHDAVYVCGLGSDNVFKIEPNGLITQVVDSTGDGVHSLDAPAGLATDVNGNVYVGGGDSDNVFQVQPDGSIVQIMDASGDGQGNTLSYPRRIRVAQDGTVYVLSSFTSKVFAISPSGVITQILDHTGDGKGHGMVIPLDLVLDIQGNAYVSGRDTNNVIKITPEGDKSQIIDADGDGRGNLLNGGSALGVDSMGRVHVGGLNSDNVFRITPDVNISQGDFDGDRDADLGDFAAFQNCFGIRPALPDLCTRLDLNLDRKINLADAELIVSFAAAP